MGYVHFKLPITYSDLYNVLRENFKFGRFVGLLSCFDFMNMDIVKENRFDYVFCTEVKFFLVSILTELPP